MGDDTRDRASLVRHATLAASSHNTQPWKFKIESNAIGILPDFSRRCPAVDPDDHHLFASLGCAAENLIWAAQADGLHAHTSFDVLTSTIRVDFEPASPRRSSLFDAIPRRQCSRSEYDGTALPAEQLRMLDAAGTGNGVSVILITDKQRIEHVAEHVAAGNNAQFSDRRWRDELQTWIRFNARAAARCGDGLYGPVMGSPDVPRWLGSLFMHFAFSAARQNRKDTADIRSSAAVAVFVSEFDDKQRWIEAGRCYERFALQATALDIRTAFINQPVEVPALRSQFAAFLGIGNCRPDLVVRVGRGPEMPRSLRRPVEEVLL
jgi:hypothetical protein